MMERRCSFLVVSTGKCSRNENRFCGPKTEYVPVPVRSSLNLPSSRTSRSSTRYWVMAKFYAERESTREVSGVPPPPGPLPWGEGEPFAASLEKPTTGFAQCGHKKTKSDVARPPL